MSDDQAELQNPLERGPKPPFPEQKQQPPGLETEMEPRPDFGEHTYKGSGRLEGRSAVITGGDSGIGRAVALAFAREGADVLISYLNEHGDAEETRRVVEEAGRRAVLVPGDIVEEEHCQRIVQTALQEFGKLDILVNNAALQMAHQSITEIPSDEWDRVYRINVYAMFYLCKAAVPHMPEGSTIINTASIEAYQPTPILLHYASTKGAIVTFSKALSKELVEKGIRVNVVAPGPVWTPLIPISMPAETVAQFGDTDPMKRPAQPAELAPAYVYLASPESSYVTGEVLGVTGGMLLP